MRSFQMAQRSAATAPPILGFVGGAVLGLSSGHAWKYHAALGSDFSSSDKQAV
uniref:Uncharacterized protein n=1 Tax=Anguilla anguilla TaxID=7936 RepID=A0A0E9TXV3_ANGAN